MKIRNVIFVIFMMLAFGSSGVMAGTAGKFQVPYDSSLCELSCLLRLARATQCVIIENFVFHRKFTKKYWRANIFKLKPNEQKNYHNFNCNYRCYRRVLFYVQYR